MAKNTGIWLADGHLKGKEFSDDRTSLQYPNVVVSDNEAAMAPPEVPEPTEMVFKTIFQGGKSHGIWVPAEWENVDAARALAVHLA